MVLLDLVRESGSPTCSSEVGLLDYFEENLIDIPFVGGQFMGSNNWDNSIWSRID